MNSFIARLLIVVCGVCLLLPCGRAFADNSTPRPKDPDLTMIVDVLKQVKTSDNPGERLDNANKLLGKQAKKTARDDKEKEAQADLDKARKSVGEAKDALTAGDKQTMGEKVDHAISEVKMAMEARERR